MSQLLVFYKLFHLCQPLLELSPGPCFEVLVFSMFSVFCVQTIFCECR